MSYTLFIADLHLCHSRPDMTDAFFKFIREQVSDDCDALYILGDFFEYWIGDDNNTPFHANIAKTIKGVSNRLPVYFIHGNRDFLLGQQFAKSAGMTLLPELQVIDLYGQPTLILHGDSLCTLDADFMKFRKKSRKKWWQTMMLSLPLFIRRHIARKARRKSKMANQHKNSEIMDVTPYEVIKQMIAHDVDLMIHGHTHRPNIHFIDESDPPKQRIVLGDWYNQGSYLVCTVDGHELKTLVFPRSG
jgi:UDP-2,3-diacylglucosamine hydrolase